MLGALDVDLNLPIKTTSFVLTFMFLSPKFMSKRSLNGVSGFSSGIFISSIFPDSLSLLVLDISDLLGF